MKTIKEKLAERGLKPVGDREYELFVLDLMRGKAGSKSSYTLKTKKARKELNIPITWNLVNIDFKK